MEQFKENSSSGPEEFNFDMDAFDMQALEQSAGLLKDELPIAVEEYLEDAVAYIKEIEEGLAAGDPDKVTNGSHPLKSNSKGFGLVAVSEIAEAINNSARQGELAVVHTLCPQLQEAFKRAEKKLYSAIRNAGY